MSTNNQKKSRYAPLILVVVLLLALLVVKQCNSKKEPAPSPSTKREKTTSHTTTSTKGLNRNPAVIHYSKHARCRMDCRHISEAEVKDVLKNGTINYKKSELGNQPDCERKYALEGNTKDGQRVRIIVAPCQSELTVVTVIDLGKEWECDCQ